MKNFNIILVITCLCQLTSCQLPLNKGESNSKNTNIINPTPVPTTSLSPLPTSMPPHKDVPINDNKKENIEPEPFIPPKQKLNFDTPPPESAEIIPGTVIVFYHNKDKFRVSTTESVTSSNASYQEQINKILIKYKVKFLHSQGYYDPADAKKIICKGEHFNEFHKNEPEAIKFFENNPKCDTMNYTDSPVTIQKIAEEQELVGKNFEGEFPDNLSIHIYEFPEDSDTRKIAKEIRDLSFVRTAYPEVKIGFSSSTPPQNSDNKKDGANLGSDLEIVPK